VRIVGLLLGWTMLSLPYAAAADGPHNVAAHSVVAVRAYSANGSLMLGSAIAVGPRTLVTNCHVTHGARRVEIVSGGRASPAAVAAEDIGRDVCFLETARVTAMPADTSRDVGVGQKVFAAGFPAYKALTLTEGRVVALHEYDGERVIQVSAPFDHGASGGALLDEQGHVLGMLTFKARAGGAFHFVVPAAWLSSYARAAHKRAATQPFWQGRNDDLPYFLRAASMEAASDWRGLMKIATAWKEREPADGGAWRAFRKAQAQLVPTSANHAGQ
jgi:serine protease Do